MTATTYVHTQAICFLKYILEFLMNMIHCMFDVKLHSAVRTAQLLHI